MTVTDVITAGGAVLTGLGLIYTGVQLRLSRKIARSQFLLQLYELMEQHNELHSRLTGLGWPEGRTAPQTVEEWIQVGRMLGLFEYIQILVADKIIDIDTVDKLYSYRLFHIVNNKEIYNRYFSADGSWDGVTKLLEALKHRQNFNLSTKYVIKNESTSEISSETGIN
jgi:hypothetical protein